MAHQLTLNTTALEELKAKALALPAEKKVQASKSVTPGTTEQTVTPDSGYDGLASVTVNAMPAGSVGTPSISVNSSTGVITATAAVDAGYVDGTDKTGTKTLTTKAAATITPGTSNQTIAAGTYLTGNQTIAGDADLKAANIKSGVNIFNVAGTMEPKEFSIVTTVESGANVTATKGSTTISGTSTGTCTLKVPTAGAWTVKATTTNNEHGETETSDSKTVTTVDSYSTSLTFWRASITVVTEEGATVTVTKGNTTYTKVATDGIASFTILASGTWTVTAVGSTTDSITVSVAEAKNYGIALLKGPQSVLNDNSWTLIGVISSSGGAANYWAVGDTKKITINGTVGQTTFSSLSVWAFILGFDHNSSVEGTGKIHFQIGKTAQSGGTDICLIDAKYGNSVSSTAGYFSMNYSSSNSGGWKSSKMRTTLLGNSNAPSSPLSGSLIAALPSDLRGVMKACTKYSDNTGGGSNTASYVTSTTDYLWLLAEYEVFGTRSYANSAEQNYQKQYTYYANGNSRVKYRHSSTSSTAHWWLRSTHAATPDFFSRVASSGSAGSGEAGRSYGVAPAFCV